MQPGDTVTLSAVVRGSPEPFTFEWRRGSTILITATQTSGISFLTLTNVRSAQAGAYYVLVRNAANSLLGVSSATATIALLPDAWETQPTA